MVMEKKTTTPMGFCFSSPSPSHTRSGAGQRSGNPEKASGSPAQPVPDAAIGDDDEESSSVGERGLRGAEGMKHALDPVPGGGGHWPIATQGTPRPLRGSPSGLQACIHLVLLLLGSGTAGVALLAGPDSVCDEVAVFERWGPFWVRLVDFCGFNLLFLDLREGREGIARDVRCQDSRQTSQTKQASSAPGLTNMITTPHDGSQTQKAQHSQL